MLRGHGCKFHRLVHVAVKAFFEERIYGKAAQRVGVARSTLYRWTKESRFRRLYELMRRTRLAA
jgi:transposase-like protein